MYILFVYRRSDHNGQTHGQLARLRYRIVYLAHHGLEFESAAFRNYLVQRAKLMACVRAVEYDSIGKRVRALVLSLNAGAHDKPFRGFA